MTSRRWWVAGTLSLAGGLVAVAASVPLMLLADGGWPWHASVSEVVGVSAHADIQHDDGRVETFTGTVDEAEAWLAQRESQLRREAGIDRKIATGRALAVGGLTLLAAGTATLAWRLTHHRTQAPLHR